MLTSVKKSTASPQVTDTLPLIIFMTGTDTTQHFIYHSHHIHPWLKKTGTCLLKASNILLYYFVSIKSLLSTILFHNLDPSKVKRIFLFCGTNNVDNVLCTPPYMRSEFLSGYQINNNILFESKEQITLLSQFLHSWANSAVINVLNILPRVSFIRNSVINKLNYHILQLCNKYSYIKIVSTESHRSLFSFHNGLRKDNFFMTKGGDNVHLNKIGLSRLAKYLKYYSHHS